MSSPNQFHGMPMHHDPRYQQSPVPDEGSHRMAAAHPSASRESSASLMGPGGGVGGGANSPGSSYWKGTPLRMANMFDSEGAQYSAEEGRFGGATSSQPVSEDDSHHAVNEASRSTTSKAAMTRVAKACVPCSTKKRRCDGGKPECKVCVVLGTPCSYESKGLKRGPPKGFRSGPKESAKARLIRNLETTIRDLSLQMGTDDTAKEILRISQDRGIVVAGSSFPGVDATHPSKKLKRSISEPSGKEEVEEGGEEEDFLGVNEQGSIRHFGSSSGIQLLHTQTPASHSLHRPSNLRENSQRSRIASNGNPSTYPLPTVPNRLHGIGSSTSHSNSPLHSPVQQFQGAPIPKVQSQVSTDLNRKLFHHYWEGFHPFWPVLYKPAFDELSLDHLPQLLDIALTNAIYAIAVCVASPSLDAEVEAELGDAPAGEVFFLRAESHLFGGRSTPTPSLSSIQVCFFLALYCQGSGQLSKAYIYSSLANSMSFDLGLHRHLHHYDNNPVEKESRIRLIHCVYITSTILSAEMGRPPMMRSKDIDVPLLNEKEQDEFETDQNGNQLCSASCLNGGVRLFSIVETVLSQIHSFRRKAALRRMGSDSTRKVVEEIGQRLETWRKTLPDALKLSSDRKTISRLLPNFIAVHLWYHTAVLLLHRPFIPHDEGSSLHEVLNDPCHIKCTKASNELFQLLLLLSNSNDVDRLSTDLAYCIFTAAVMFVFNARLGQSATSTDEKSNSNSSSARVIELSNEAKRQFFMCKEWLRSLSARWPAASAHKQLLDGFATVGEDVLAGGGLPEGDRTTRGGAAAAAEDEKPSWLQQSGPTTSTWGVSSERDMSRNRRGALDASHEQVDTTSNLDATNVSFGTPASNVTRYSGSTGSYSDGGANSMGQQPYYQEGSQYMYYPTSSNNNSNIQAPTQQQSNFQFAPNIFDMESVYWNETAARNTSSSDGIASLSNQRLQQQQQQQQQQQVGSGNMSFSNANNISVLAAVPTSQPPSRSTQSSNVGSAAPTINGLQMLAQATTANMEHVSPFTFHQEPAQPEWSDVINMLQLPPAFLQ